jgi:hypothetical protein
MALRVFEDALMCNGWLLASVCALRVVRRQELCNNVWSGGTLRTGAIKRSLARSMERQRLVGAAGTEVFHFIV